MTRREFLNTATGAGVVAGIAAFSGPEGLMAQNHEKAKKLNLKVTDLKTYIVSRSGKPNSNNYVFCRIFTNQGIVGTGEGSVTSKAKTMASLKIPL